MKRIIAITALLSACTFVNENPKAQSVAITTIDDVSQCNRVGSVAAKTKAQLGFIKRGSEKVQDELQTLARNEALKIGANTLVPESKAVEGKQSFIAFNCAR